MRWVPAVAVVAAACQVGPSGGGFGPSRQAPEQALRIAAGSTPATLDPAKGRSDSERLISRLISEPLLKPAPDLRDVQPAAAASYDVSSDGLTYNFHLREGAAYWDGHPVVAADFVFAWQRLIDPRTAAPTAVFFAQAVKNGEEVAALDPDVEGGRIDSALSELGLAAPDPRTFRVTLARPSGSFKWIATLWNGVPVRRDALQGRDSELATHPERLVTNGAFHIASLDARHFELERSERYAPRAQLRRVSISFLAEGDLIDRYRRGSLDVVAVSGAAAGTVAGDRTPAAELLKLRRLEMLWMTFNVSRPPFDSLPVRQAFSSALDRGAYIGQELHGMGQPARTLIPAGMRGYNPELERDGSPDPARARTLLDAAGVPPERLSGAHLLVRATDRGRRNAELIRAQLRQNLGIELAVEEAPSAEVLADRLKDGDFQLCAPLGWSADYPDEQDWFDLFRSNDANNSGQWRNPRYDALVGVADALIDPDQREHVYQQAHRLLVEQVPVAFLAQPESWVLRRGHVAGAVVTAFDDPSLPGDLYPELIRITQH